MMSFSQYLEEKKVMAAALAGIVGGVGLGLTPRPSVPQATPVVEPQVTQPAPVQPQAQLPKPQVQIPQTKEKQKEQFKFSSPHVEKFLNAISKVEHRGVKNVNHLIFDPRTAIRTKSGDGSSSSWGAYQLTMGTVADHFKRRPHLFKGNEKFVTDFINQGTRFLNSKNNDKVYGLGSPGTLATPENHENYLRMADSVTRSMFDDIGVNHEDGLSDKELTAGIKRWRGLSEEEDPRYFERVRNNFNTRK